MRKPRKEKRVDKQVEIPAEHVAILLQEVEKRRSKWRLVSLDFDDVAQKIHLRVVKKYHTYIPDRGPFIKWCNRVITHTIWNVLRDNYLKYSRPCIKHCKHNLGEGQCSFTKSGTQCGQCIDYRKWEASRKDQYNINQTLPYENHIPEIDMKTATHLNADLSLDKLNIEMKKRLRPSEWKIYNEVYIANVGKPVKTDTIKGYNITYQAFAKLKKTFIITAKKILAEQEAMN